MNDIRRLAAIMFTDIVGYSSLMSQDEQNALEIMRKNRSIQQTLVEKYNGKWLKEIGDGALAMFDTAYDSVQCGLAIQKEIKASCTHQVRIGIHLGDIALENEDAFGDGVNIASRIEAIADPGGIFISESVYKAFRGRMEVPVKDLGELQLKNIYPIRVYALTGEGLPFPSNRTSSLNQKHKQRTRQKSKILALTIALLLFVSFIIIWKYTSIFNRNAASIQVKQSIAVLPFANLSNDPEQEFMVDGLHDAIIGKLSQIPSLRVISRTSTLRYRNTDLAVPEIAKQLKVDNIVEGSIFGNGGLFRIQMQLIKAFPQEAHVWSEEYERSLDKIFNMKEDVSRDVAKALNVDVGTLSRSTQEVNPEVYKLYLRGMHLLDKGRPEDMLAGMEYLNEAVDVDPTAAFAYAGMAQGYIILGHSPISQSEHFIKAKAAAKQALELDDKLADAYAALADVKMYYDWDYEGAWVDFEKSILLKPNLAEAHAHYTWLHVIYNRWDEAIEEAKLAVEIDPFSTIYTSWLAWLYWWAGRNDEAIEIALATLKLNPDFSVGYMVLGSAYAEKGRYTEAIEALQKAVDMTPHWTSHLCRALILSGQKEEAEKVFMKAKNSKSLTTQSLGFLYASMGYKDEALDYLEKLIEERSRIGPWIHAAPFSKFMRNDPRFIELCKKANIPEEALSQGKKTKLAMISY